MFCDKVYKIFNKNPPHVKGPNSDKVVSDDTAYGCKWIILHDGILCLFTDAHTHTHHHVPFFLFITSQHIYNYIINK